MPCPYYKDYVRECAEHIAMVPEINTIPFCISKEYQDCPFYRSIEKIGSVCEFAECCPIFRRVSIKDFEKFGKLTVDYCLSENFRNCERFKINMRGRKPPPTLLPDGGQLDE